MRLRGRGRIVGHIAPDTWGGGAGHPPPQPMGPPSPPPTLPPPPSWREGPGAWRPAAGKAPLVSRGHPAVEAPKGIPNRALIPHIGHYLDVAAPGGAGGSEPFTQKRGINPKVPAPPGGRGPWGAGAPSWPPAPCWSAAAWAGTWSPAPPAPADRVAGGTGWQGGWGGPLLKVHGRSKYMYLIEVHPRPDEAKRQRSVHPKNEGK